MWCHTTVSFLREPSQTCLTHPHSWMPVTWCFPWMFFAKLVFLLLFYHKSICLVSFYFKKWFACLSRFYKRHIFKLMFTICDIIVLLNNCPKFGWLNPSAIFLKERCLSGNAITSHVLDSIRFCFSFVFWRGWKKQLFLYYFTFPKENTSFSNLFTETLTYYIQIGSWLVFLMK